MSNIKSDPNIYKDHQGSAHDDHCCRICPISLDITASVGKWASIPIIFCIYFSQPRRLVGRNPATTHTTEVSTCGSVWWSPEPLFLPRPGTSDYQQRLCGKHMVVTTATAEVHWHLHSSPLLPCQVCLAPATTTMSSHSRQGKRRKTKQYFATGTLLSLSVHVQCF